MMSDMEVVLMVVLEVIGVIVVVGVVGLAVTYNRLITLRNRLNNAESQIDVQLKRRYDLIPNLVETVKGYAKHEKDLFKEVTAARAALNNATKNYPTLKANENFMMLQEELSGTESKIAYSRQFYNDTVQMYNTSIQMFPTSIIANLFGFKQGEFFETDKAEKEPVKVKF
jgi:LemA protein